MRRTQLQKATSPFESLLGWQGGSTLSSRNLVAALILAFPPYHRIMCHLQLCTLYVEPALLNISDSMSPAALAAYHDGSGDYYLEGEVATSKWGGSLAKGFGLAGAIDHEQYKRLCYGRDPHTNEKLKPGKDGNRGGWDVTFSVPKEVSLAYLDLRTRDQEAADKLLNEFLESTEVSMATMEKEAAVQMKNPKRWDKTGNWLWARYLHFDSRPDEKTGMPVIQIHAHYVVFNLTKTDRGMRALEIGNLKSPRSHGQQQGTAALHMAEWHSDLARRMRGMGAGIKRTKSIGFGIEGISRELVEKWSPRRATIKEAKKRILEAIDEPEKRAELMEKYQVKNWDAFRAQMAKRLQGELAKITRLHKQKNLSRDELWAYWESQLTNDDRKALASVWGKSGWETDASTALQFSLEHNLYRQSVASEKQILIDALRYGVGSVSVQSLKAEYQKLGVLVNDNGELSTQKTLDQEGRIIDFAREGRGTMRPLVAETHKLSPEQQGHLLSNKNDTETQYIDSYSNKKGQQCSNEQQAAIRHVLNSTDQVILIRGGAGTGKTTMMKTAIAEIDKPVAVLAPSASASRDTLRKEGFKDANTVAAFLQDEQWQQRMKGGVIWIDEAGLLPIKDLDHIVEVNKMVGARLILQGDPKQHKSVARHGSMFHVLQEYAGLPMAELKDIKRQKGKYKEAVAAIDSGDILKGHDILKEIGCIRHTDNYRPLVDKFIDSRNLGESVLVVAPTHVAGDEITFSIRNRLKAEGKLGHEEHTFKQYRNLGWSDAQKGDIHNYEGNEVIQFFRSDGAFKAGQKYGAGDLRACQERQDARKRGRKSKRPAFDPAHFSVYSEGKVGFSVGDSIRISAGGKTIEGKQIDNGQIVTVKGFTAKGDIALTNGQTLSKDFGHLAHAYTSTSYGAQGKTVDTVLVAMTKDTVGALNAEQFYVSASRGRKSATIYTDLQPAELRSLIQRQDDRRSATEVFGMQKSIMWHFIKRRQRAYRAMLERSREVGKTSIEKPKERGYRYER